MLAGVAGVLVLVLLQGIAWVTFGLPLAGIPFWARLLTGTALAPLMVGLQFYTVRVLGVSFENSAYLLVGINLAGSFFYLEAYRRTFDARFTLCGWLDTCALASNCFPWVAIL